MGEPGGLLSMGSHRVGHDRSDLASAYQIFHLFISCCPPMMICMPKEGVFKKSAVSTWHSPLPRKRSDVRWALSHICRMNEHVFLHHL